MSDVYGSDFASRAAGGSAATELNPPHTDHTAPAKRVGQTGQGSAASPGGPLSPAQKKPGHKASAASSAASSVEKAPLALGQVNARLKKVLVAQQELSDAQAKLANAQDDAARKIAQAAVRNAEISLMKRDTLLAQATERETVRIVLQAKSHKPGDFGRVERRIEAATVGRDAKIAVHEANRLNLATRVPAELNHLNDTIKATRGRTLTPAAQKAQKEEKTAVLDDARRLVAGHPDNDGLSPAERKERQFDRLESVLKSIAEEVPGMDSDLYEDVVYACTQDFDRTSYDTDRVRDIRRQVGR